MEHLPTELWNHICTFLDSSALAAFALTSSVYTIPARWQLYTALALSSESPSLDCTFRLLKSDPALARRVLSLTIDTDPTWLQLYFSFGWLAWFDLGVFEGMTRLRTLKFRRLPRIATDDDVAREFVDILNLVYEKCKSLEELTVWGIWWPQSILVPPVDLDKLRLMRPKLTKVVYNARYSSDINWPFLTYSLFTPSSFITYLDFFAGKNVSDFSDLCKLSFPSLRTLYLRSVPAFGMSSVATFLVSHPSIQHLFLFDMGGHLPHDKLELMMLPHLHTIRAPPMMLASLANKCHSLRHVRALVLDYSGVDNLREETGFLVDEVGGFPDLRHCSISHVITTAKTAEIVRMLAVESTQLTCWSGGFYYRDIEQLKLLADSLASFPALARLDICEWTYPTSPPTPEQLDTLAYLARKNPELQKMSLYMIHLPTNEISTMYRVARRASTTGFVQLKEMYRCIEGGPYIKERRRLDHAAVEWEDEVLLEDSGW